jgi:ADP-heptose:LPS heptosyltransferase
MIFVHHAGKMGDLLYALPVLRALARVHQTKIHLTTSGLCWQLVPLLWEQPYIGDVALDDTRAYELPFGVGITNHWDHYKPGEGINLSLQPKHYANDCPINWTQAYAWIAGVTLQPEDYIGLPSLVNHRRWFQTVDCRLDGKKQDVTKTIIVAPEVETLEPAPPETWTKIIDALLDHYNVVLVGQKDAPNYRHKLMAWAGSHNSPRLRDLRGCTTVPTLARLIAESAAFIGAHSMPWHLARLSGVPAFCFQKWREGLRRCIPVDTDPNLCPWPEEIEDWHAAVEWIESKTGGPAHAVSQ